MPNPDRYAQKLAQKLLPDAEEQAAFLDALAAENAARSSLLWLGEKPTPTLFSAEENKPPWCARFVDILTKEGAAMRPGQNPLHNAGAYYCLDLSSCFDAAPLLAIPKGGVVVDVCASPGGKSLFAWRALTPDLLISNEVIGKRLGALTGNLRRCGVRPAFVTRLDSAPLADALGTVADVVLVDAPCSGQSLVARGMANPGAFHPVTVNQNANRQRRILANSARLVAPGGHLLYMTCTYSKEENEDVAAWLLKRFPAFTAQSVPELEAHRSPFVSFPAYRLWPFHRFGAGGFACLLRNGADEERTPLALDSLPIVWRSDSTANDVLEPLSELGQQQ